MKKDFTFNIKSVSLDENYHPSTNTRITTNFANLNLIDALRFISLATYLAGLAGLGIQQL